MKGIWESLVSPFLVVVLVSFVSLAPALAQQYVAGVKTGDWVKYTVSFEGRAQLGSELNFYNSVFVSNYSNPTFSSPTYTQMGFLVEEIAWIENKVDSTVAEWGIVVVYTTTTIQLNNGTSVVLPGCFVSYGDDGWDYHVSLILGWDGGVFFGFMGANLSAGAPHSRYYNETLGGYEWLLFEPTMRTYLGMSRETLHVGRTFQTSGAGGDLHNGRGEFDQWFDRATGVLLETRYKWFEEVSTLVRTYSVRILDTNLFGDKTMPTARFSYSMSGLSIDLNAGESADDVGVIGYEWNFGDGNSGTGKTCTHIYSSAGTYNVTLTVKDAAGNSDMGSKIITIASEPFPPWIIAAIIGAVALGVIIGLGGAYFWRKKKTSTQQD